MHKYIAECIGTFALVFCGTGAIVINSVTEDSITHLGIAITFGLIVVAMIYAFGEISGAHINPAVTIAFWFAGKLPLKQVFPYITAQLIGAFIASILLYFLFTESSTLGETLPLGAVYRTFILEFILSFFLMLVIITMATGSKQTLPMAGLVIGLVVLLEALFAGPITGASMNPARSIAPAIVSGNIEHLWVYILAPILGMIASIFVCNCVKTNSCCTPVYKKK